MQVADAEALPEPVRYVCRTHCWQPVDWRGRGCPNCRFEHAEREREALLIRQARNEARQRRLNRKKDSHDAHLI